MKDKDLLEQVIRTQEYFIYEKKVDVEGYQVWICHTPGTRMYSFELIFGREGVYVNGDISAIVWNHRSGLDLLAGGDVDYYVYQKLDPVYKDRRTRDIDAVDKFVAERMVEWLYEEWSHAGDTAIPWPEPHLWNSDTKIDLTSISEFYEDHNLNDNSIHAQALYTNTEDATDLSEVQSIIYDYDTEHGGDGHDLTIDKPDWNVMFSMYMACYAARKIKEQEDA